MTTELKLRPVEPADREYVERVLANNDLPIADLSETLTNLYVCETETTRVGVGGLERYQDAGLIRSVAIEESKRGNGYGTSVCNELLARACSADISTVYLLTTTADEFFDNLGFEGIDRETVPPSIQDTTEFSDLCPSTAVCMKCELDEPTGATRD